MIRALPPLRGLVRRSTFDIFLGSNVSPAVVNWQRFGEIRNRFIGESWRDRSYRGESVQRYTRPCISVRTRFPPVTNTIANGSAKLFPILLFSRETANQRTVQSVAQVIGSCLVHVRSAAYRLVRASWNRSIRHRDFSIPPPLSLSLFEIWPCKDSSEMSFRIRGVDARNREIKRECNGWKGRWISMIPYESVGGTWRTKSLTDVIGIYRAEN